jgi:hypothetical protein
MASRNEADATTESTNVRGWKAANCVLKYLYNLTRDDDEDYDYELLVFGRLCVCNKFLEKEFCHN